MGNWLRYAGTRANGGIFGLAMFGQIIIGLAQPFCLCAPTRYSDLWFSDKGRTSATALASLANPLGAAIGQLVDSEWVTKPSDIPDMVLYISIIVSGLYHTCILPSTDNNSPRIVQRRINPILLPARCTTNSSKRLICHPPHAIDTRNQAIIRYARILVNPGTIRRIRWILQ